MEKRKTRSESATPTLSVVLTVFNMQECLRECLESIHAQTFEDYELICVDDGSTDNSPAILSETAPQFASCSVIRQENAGPAAARNAGIDAARGRFLLLLDADDRFAPTLFERMVSRAEETDADVVVCRSREFDHASGKTRATDWTVRAELLPCAPAFRAAETQGCPFTAFMGWPWDKLYRTSFIRECGLRFPNLPNSEDFPFVFLALVKARAIAVADETLIDHRIKRRGSTSNSRLLSPRSFYEGIVLLKRLLEQEPDYPLLKWGYLNWAVNYTCWNIESLPEGSAGRAELVRSLAAGEFDELELSLHPTSYFALQADTSWALKRLEREHRTGRAQRKSPWEYLSVGFDRLGKSKLARTAKRTAAQTPES